MQDRLSAFMLRYPRNPAPQLLNTVAAAQGLAKAVIDVNNFFMDSKHLYRSHLISFSSSGENHPEKWMIDQVSRRHHQTTCATDRLAHDSEIPI